MQVRLQRILGISAGSRYIGIAVLNGTELIDWKLKSFPGKWTNEKEEKVKRTIEDYFKLYRPNAVSVKIIYPSRSSSQIHTVLKYINELARWHRIWLYQFSIEQVKQKFFKDKKSNKKEIAEMVAAMFPILFHQLHQKTHNKNLYYMRVFEAVALAVVCRDHIDKKCELVKHNY